MRCLKPNGTYTTTSWKYFYPKCSRQQQVLGICSGKSGAYIAAVTVCAQKLF